jgi:hypothetical protein
LVEAVTVSAGGRPAFSLLELVLRGGFRITRHERLLLTDDSISEELDRREAAEMDPDEPETAWLIELERWQRSYRDGWVGTADHWFARLAKEGA